MSEDRRSLQGDLARLGSATADVDRTLRHAVSAQPLLAVGAAAGIGFLLGGGLSRGAATLLLGVGARIAGAWLDEQVRERAHAQEENET
jgi:hypothetical protein